MAAQASPSQPLEGLPSRLPRDPLAAVAAAHKKMRRSSQAPGDGDADEGQPEVEDQPKEVR